MQGELIETWENGNGLSASIYYFPVTNQIKIWFKYDFIIFELDQKKIPDFIEFFSFLQDELKVLTDEEE